MSLEKRTVGTVTKIQWKVGGHPGQTAQQLYRDMTNVPDEALLTEVQVTENDWFTLTFTHEYPKPKP